MMSLRERKLAEVQKMCKDAGQNMFNLALSAKNSGEVSSYLLYLIDNNKIAYSSKLLFCGFYL